MAKRPPVKLTPRQRDCVTYATDQPLLIRGIPGSGKTTILLERAQYLEQHGEKLSDGPKVIFLAYSRLLARYVRHLNVESGESKMKAFTFHKWGLQLLDDLGIRSKGTVVGEKEREKVLQIALDGIRRHGSDMKLPNIPVPKVKKGEEPPIEKQDEAIIEFLADEIEWIKGLGKDRARYMNEQRTGRGTSIQVYQHHKEWLWRIYELYQAILKKQEQFDWDDIAILLQERIGQIPMSKRPSHILIDEAQDLTVMQLKVIAQMGLRSITIAADKGQSIYNRSFTWAGVGIDIRGRSRSLEKSYRSTRQIVRLANSLRRFEPLAIKKDEEYVPAEEPDIDGPVPQLYVSPTIKEQQERVVDWVKRCWKSFPDQTIGIIAPRHRDLRKYEKQIQEAGIPVVQLRYNQEADVFSPGVKLVTYYSSKGLEFDHVAVTALREGTMPLEPSKEMSTEDVGEYLATERRKLFVAITRGRVNVALFASEPVSRFVAELDGGLFAYVRG